MSIASGGVAVSPPRIRVRSRPARGGGVGRADGRFAGGVDGPVVDAADGPVVGAVVGRFVGAADGSVAGTAVGSVAGTAFRDMPGVDAPPSGMCPSLCSRSALYALSSYRVPSVI
jgi:hypothetical protein